VPDPLVVARPDHPISRRAIDPDALKVLYRLNEHKYTAYLVGGSVRDLILGRRPKDFDIGTDAHPYQIKKLFRNCWVIGRRFRLAHIKFGLKTIEVATFRRVVPEPETPAEAPPEGVRDADTSAIIHRDNTFGTPEEDAFRRDFTVNGLFYDVATRSVIDYVGGLEDLEHRIIRSIGDPRIRFVEDPVRMLRAAVLGARLGFDMDALVIEAIAEHRGLIAKASPARLLEEYYKILRSGCAEASFRALDRVRLLELITPEMASPPPALWDSLARIDRFRQQFPDAPPQLTNCVLIGSLLVPLDTLNRRPAPGGRPDRVEFGMLPVARRDLERLRQVVVLAPRLAEPDLSPRFLRSLPNRSAFPDSLTWLEIFGDAPEAVERLKQIEHVPEPVTRRRRGRRRGGQAHAPAPAAEARPIPDKVHPEGPPDGRRRRRRRRRRGRGRGGGGGGGGEPGVN